MNLGFLITDKCNAQCGHCSTNCGPKQNSSLKIEDIIQLMNEAKSISGNEKLQFCISGGEPFLDFIKLKRIFAHGSNLGAELTCVTNCFWATNSKTAYEKLNQLKSLGLTGIGFSISDFHQKYISIERVFNAINASKRLKINTILKHAYLKESNNLETIFRDRNDLLDGVEIESFPILPNVRSGVIIQEDSFISDKSLPEGKCPSAVITIKDDGDAYTCCTPGGFVEPLKIGNISVDNLQMIENNFYFNGIQRILFTRGPIHFANILKSSGYGAYLKGRYSGVCELCTHLMNDQFLSSIVIKEAKRFEIEETNELFFMPNS